MCVCACKTHSLIPRLLHLHLCGHAIFISEWLKQQPRLPCTHTRKVRSTHTTAVKRCTNTFYRPPLTSLIRTLHLKVRGGRKRKQICLQGLTLAATTEASLAAVFVFLWLFSLFFEELFPFFLQVSATHQATTSSSENWSQCATTFFLKASKKKSDSIEVYEKMSLLLTWFITSVNWFWMILCSRSLVSSLLQHSMMFI